VVIFNNSKLGLIKMEQEAAGLPEFGTDLANPDFARVARAMGADGLRVEAPDEIAPALGKAISSSRPFVIDAVIDPNEMTIPPKIQAGFALNFAKAKAKELLQPGGSVKDTLGSVKDAAKRAFEKA
jgi:thiamine pyrophosphate-dependent acetolactate synthase large subunit-like protein